MGCASGTTKTEAWKFDDEVIAGVRGSCSQRFDEANSGLLADLWANKRSILKSARSCAAAANILADMAENRNKVIGK